jgi:uncharacterized membrane protein YqjE
MAEQEGSTRETTASELPRLLARLVERSISFIEQRIALAEDEVRDQVRRGAEAAGWVGLALALGLVGAVLLSLGLSVLLSTFGVPLWLSHILLGLASIGAGGLVVHRLSRRGEGRRTLDRTLAELEKDRASLAGRS